MTTPEQRSSAESDPDATGPEAIPETPDTAYDETDADGREESAGSPRGRPRVISAEISRDRGWNSVVEVVLERDGRTAAVRRDAVGEEAVLFRCAAETTLAALHQLLGPPERFALVGAKRILAFDSAVVLACVRTLTGRPRKLIGCVPVGEDPILSVARAILHATNRILEALPNAPETEGSPPQQAPEPDTGGDASGDPGGGTGDGEDEVGRGGDDAESDDED